MGVIVDPICFNLRKHDISNLCKPMLNAFNGDGKN